MIFHLPIQQLGIDARLTRVRGQGATTVLRKTNRLEIELAATVATLAWGAHDTPLLAGNQERSLVGDLPRAPHQNPRIPLMTSSQLLL